MLLGVYLHLTKKKINKKNWELYNQIIDIRPEIARSEALVMIVTTTTTYKKKSFFFDFISHAEKTKWKTKKLYSLLKEEIFSWTSPSNL